MRVVRPIVLALSSRLLILGVPGMASAGGANTYRVQFDSTKAGEPWAFLRIFPHQITVHQGDILNAQLAGTDTPHTVTVVNAVDAEQWRSVNQCQGCQYETVVPDSAVGGDDNELVLNPSVAFPSSFTCGSVSSPCSFNGVTVVNSGITFPNPSDQPSFYVSMDAAPG